MFPLSLAANNRTSETVKHEPRSGKGKLLLATRSKHTQASALLQERKKWFLSVLVVGRRWKTPGRKMQLQMQPSRDHVCIFEIIDLHQVIDSQWGVKLGRGSFHLGICTILCVMQIRVGLRDWEDVPQPWHLTLAAICCDGNVDDGAKSPEWRCALP